MTQSKKTQHRDTKRIRQVRRALYKKYPQKYWKIVRQIESEACKAIFILSRRKKLNDTAPSINGLQGTSGEKCLVSIDTTTHAFLQEVPFIF